MIDSNKTYSADENSMERLKEIENRITRLERQMQQEIRKILEEDLKIRGLK